MKKRALISVSNKDKIVEFANFLVKNDYEIISTSGTFKLLKDNNIPVIQVSEVTQSKEILDGRVKTLHPSIHGGILADLSKKNHLSELSENHIKKIDLVVVNLYPFKETVQNLKSNASEIIENIDIGGPTMIRSAAKNYKFTTVICEPNDYEIVESEITNNKEISLELKQKLSGKAFSYTAHYDACINSYFKKINNIGWYDNDSIPLLMKQSLRYGENPHQQGMFFKNLFVNNNSLFKTKKLNGKELSYNNIIDVNSIINIMYEFNDKPTAVGLKHTNSCGLASASNIEKAWDLAYQGDPISIFGGIVCLNREVTLSLAKKLFAIFLEVIVAPKFSEEALKLLKRKKNLRLLELELKKDVQEKWSVRKINGGYIIQDVDPSNWKEEFKNLRCVTKAKYNKLADLEFAWKTVKHIKSNAITITRDTQLIGMGAGQPNRVESVRIAMNKNPELVKNAILASDAFFPMRDSIDEIAKADIKAIIQPGGSIRDQEVIDACNEHNIAMYFVGKRHFLH